MAVEAKFRIYGELSGLGNDKIISTLATLSDVPTKGSGPVVMPIATTPTLIDTLGIISGELIALYVKAHSGDIHIDPYSTAVVTTVGCYLPEGQSNLYTFESSISNVPSAQAVSAVSLLEYMVVAIS